MMSTVTIRSNGIFGFLISTLSVLTVLLVLSTYFLHDQPEVDINTARVNLLVPILKLYN